MHRFSSRSRLALVLGACALLLGMCCAPAAAPAAAVSSAAQPDHEAPSWLWPLAEDRVITRAYEAPAHPWGAGHRGIDASAHAGSAVRAPADGVVSFAGIVVDRPVISVRHSDGVVSSFEAVSPRVQRGDTVRRGDVIGVVVSGPHCGSACLHIGVRVNGSYVNPLIFFGGLERAVLLPLALTPAGAPTDSSL